MKKLSAVAVVVLLGVLVFAQSQPTQLKVTFNTADDPLCATATSVDCIFQARIVKGTATVKTVPFSSFAVASGVATATVDITSIPVGYGSNTFIALLDAKAADASLVASDVSVSVSVVRRPKAPGLVAQ